MADAAGGDAGTGTLAQQAMEAVDSGAVEPGVSSEAATETVEAGSETAAPPGDESASPAEGEAAGRDEIAELEAFFSDGSSEEGEQKEEKPAEGETDESGSRANRRIQALAGRVKQGEKRYGELSQHYRTAYEQNQRLRQQLHEQKVALARLEERTKLGPQGEPDPVDQFEQRVRAAAAEQAQQALSPQIKQALEKLQHFENQQQQQRELAERRERSRKINAAADAAVAQEILPHVDGEVLNDGLKDRYARMVMMVQATERVDLKTAAQVVRSMFNTHARGVIRARSKKNGEKLRASQQTPEPAPKGRAGATGESLPDWGKLQDAGYKSYHQWQAAGSPPLG